MDEYFKTFLLHVRNIAAHFKRRVYYHPSADAMYRAHSHDLYHHEALFFVDDVILYPSFTNSHHSKALLDYVLYYYPSPSSFSQDHRGHYYSPPGDLSEHL